MVTFEPTPNKSQQVGQTHATCCDMLRWHVAIVCRGVSEPEPTLWVYPFVIRFRQSSPEPDYKQSLSFHSLDQEAKKFVSLLLVLPRVFNPPDGCSEVSLCKYIALRKVLSTISLSMRSKKRRLEARDWLGMPCLVSVRLSPRPSRSIDITATYPRRTVQTFSHRTKHSS